MNDVEIYSSMGGNDVLNNSTNLNFTNNFNATDIMATGEPTEIPVTTEVFDFTTIGTFMETVYQNIAIPGLEFHKYYIYVWTIGIVGCIIFTTGR